MQQLVAMIAINVRHSYAQIMQNQLTTPKASDFDKMNNVAIYHLLASMFKIYRYIFSDNWLHLALSPIGLVWMRDKITQAEI